MLSTDVPFKNSYQEKEPWIILSISERGYLLEDAAIVVVVTIFI
jgi:hypothetical protein